MKLDPIELSNILKYWMTVEELTPFELQPDMLMADLSDGINTQNANIFIWDKVKEEGKRSFQIELDRLTEKFEVAEYMKIFTVCVGVVEINEYVKKVVNILSASKSKRDLDVSDVGFFESAGNGKMCLATFKINHFGKVLPHTFNASSALSWLALHNSSLSSEQFDGSQQLAVGDALASHFCSLCRDHLKSALSSNVPEKDLKEVYSVEYTKSKHGVRRLRDLRQTDELKVNVGFLDEVSRYICKLAGIATADSVWVVEQFQKRPHKVVDDFMNSPYLDPLGNLSLAVKEKSPELLLSKVLTNFFKYSHGNAVHNDVLRDPRALYEIADPRLFNLGRWPDSLSKKLSVCQQIAVSRICQASEYNPIVTVNGPPGTGKTTLLRDVLADVVVRRGYEIAGISDIRNEEIFEITYSGTTPVQVLKPNFTKDFPIIVVSNTNNAIENISKEIPLQYGFEEEEGDYFSDLSNEIFGQNQWSWGLLSLPLGKSANWNKAYDALFKRDKNRKSVLSNVFAAEEEKLGGFAQVCKLWEKEKENFLKLYTQVRESLAEQYKVYLKDIKAASPASWLGSKITSILHKEEGLKSSEFYFDFSKRENLDRHLEQIYTAPDLDSLRTKLFLSSLRLHKYTILIHRQRFVNSIEKSFLTMGNREFINDPLPFLGTFCFFCPLISSTLASSPLRFGKYLKGSLPWVLIDEASQVTPQSAVLMMQKAKRLIVVGDPQQLQPVVTLPRVINELLTDENKKLRNWSPFNFSLQNLCDNTQTYGTRIGENIETSIWTGLPLRAQRRSFSPMFDISNAISYENQMVLGKERRNRGSIEALIPSFWLDVNPEQEYSTNAVDEEIDAVIDVLRYIYGRLVNANLRGELSKPKTLMIVTPFRAVAAAVRGKLKGASRSNDFFRIVRIGTTHVMQGQQADIVIFVLGSKKGEMGSRARLWATEPPNLINVAVSRAIESLIIIGNANEWEGLGPMSEIVYQLRFKGDGVLSDLPQDE